MVFIRQAVASDVESISAFDRAARADADRRSLIERSVAQGECFIATPDSGSEVVAYGMLEYSFYGHGFIPLLYVEANHRRQNYGAALINHLESICRTEKIFTSTNLSNIPMQSLLAKLEYKLSGVIHDLDEGDPELVYSKLLRQAAP